MEVVELKQGDEKLWDNYVLQSDESTFFHQIGWKNVVEETYGHKPIYLVARENDQIKGILPLFLIKSKIFGKKLVSLPFAPYGGVCADDSEIESKLVEEAKEKCYKCNADYLELRYLHNVDIPSFISKSDYVTSILELDSDPKVVRHRLKKDKRKMITRSEKQNLAFEWTSDVTDFYKLFAYNMRDLGSPVHSRRFFENILTKLRSQVLEVKLDNEVIYAAFYLFYKDRIINSWSSTLREYRKYLPTDFGIWKAIEYGCRNGFSYYDFGRSQVDSSNYEFKRRWSTNPIPLYYLYHLNRAKEVPDITLANPQRQNFSKIWRRVPVSLTKFAGPLFRKTVP